MLCDGQSFDLERVGLKLEEKKGEIESEHGAKGTYCDVCLAAVCQGQVVFRQGVGRDGGVKGLDSGVV